MSKIHAEDGQLYTIQGWNQFVGFNEWLREVSAIHQESKPHNLSWRDGENLPWLRNWLYYFQQGFTPIEAIEHAMIDDKDSIIFTNV